MKSRQGLTRESFENWMKSVFKTKLTYEEMNKITEEIDLIIQDVKNGYDWII